MAVPPEAFKFEAEMDPAEVLDYEFNLTAGELKLLDGGEQIASFTLTLYPEAVALGLNIMTGGGRDPSDDGVSIKVWFDFDIGLQTDAAYDGAGTDLAMELTVVTDSAPTRTRQRTCLLGVKQL